jgi:ankyrin repeat protein
MYFIITDKDGKYNNHQYADGLNIFPQDFNDYVLSDSGFHIFDQNGILKILCDYHVYLREVTLPTCDEKFKILKYQYQYRTNMIILGKQHKLSDIETFMMLVYNGVDIRSHNNNAIRWAINNKNLEIAKFLIEHGANIKIDDHCLLLYKASVNNDVEMVNFLINNGSAINPSKINDLQPIEGASMRGHLEVVKILIENGAYLDYRSVANACINGHLHVVKILVENGAKIRGFDHAISYASKYNHLEIVNYLIEKGADIHADNDRSIRNASKNNNFKMVELLVENGADIHADDDYAIRNASENNNFEMVKYLIEKGIHISTKDNYIINTASKNGNLEMVKYLVEKGATVDGVYMDNSSFNFKPSALYISSKKGHLDIVKFLYEHKSKSKIDEKTNDKSKIDEKTNDKSKIDEKTNDKGKIDGGCSIDIDIKESLAIAASKGHFEVVKYLFANASKPNIAKKALVNALMNGHLIIASFLFHSGIELPDSEFNSLCITSKVKDHNKLIKHILSNFDYAKFN